MLLSLLGILSLSVGCQNKQQAKVVEKVETSLFDKDLEEIKLQIYGEWELVSGVNEREFCEYDNTFIQFDGDQYVWTEDGKAEPGSLNWRKADTGAGYESYLMDVFFETNPAYPLLIKGDTLVLQDCTKTQYKYTLLRKK